MVSAFSNATIDAIKTCDRHWEEIAGLCLEQGRNIGLIAAEVEAMTKSCNVQKNVNMTIKEGLKKIRDLVDAIDRDHKAASEKEKSYRQLQELSEELRQDRRKTHDRLQA